MTVESEWRVVQNWASSSEGSIHDDETARAKGFPGGLVPGDVHIALVTAALVDRFDTAWYEQGWLRHTFVAPAYNGERLRVCIEPSSRDDGDADVVAFQLERDDGALICTGVAGVYEGDGGAPPWLRADASPARGMGAGDPLPHEPVGTEYEQRTRRFETGAFDRSIDGHDPSAWYRTESPWGAPIIPTVGPFDHAHRIKPTPAPPEVGAAMRSGMNAGFELLQRGPLFYDTDYVRRARLVEKGIAGRYGFRTVEFSLTPEASDAPLFVGRWRIKWVLNQ